MFRNKKGRGVLFHSKRRRWVIPLVILVALALYFRRMPVAPHLSYPIADCCKIRVSATVFSVKPDDLITMKQTSFTPSDDEFWFLVEAVNHATYRRHLLPKTGANGSEIHKIIYGLYFEWPDVYEPMDYVTVTGSEIWVPNTNYYKHDYGLHPVLMTYFEQNPPDWIVAPKQ